MSKNDIGYPVSRRTLNKMMLAGAGAGFWGLGAGAPSGLAAAPSRAPASEPSGRLDGLQLSHIRHTKNLASQPDGDWSKMGADDADQELWSSYRYQVAYMAYGLAMAHYHHLPATPGVFKQSYENIMRKMYRYDV
jgi:hypothetical protein